MTGNYLPRLFSIAAASAIVFAGGCQPPLPKGDSTDPTGAGSAGNKSGRSSGAMTGKSLNNWKNVFAEMKAVLDLDAAEQEKIESTYRHHVSSIQAWYQEHGQTIAQSDAEALDAIESRDVNRLKRLTKKITPLRNEVMKMHTAMDKAVLDAFTEKTRFRWQGYRLASRLFQLCKKIDLNEQQRKQIVELGASAAEWVKAKTNPQAAGFMELEKRVEAQVFTATQLQNYAEIKDKNKLRSLKKLSSYQNSDGSFSK